MPPSEDDIRDGLDALQGDMAEHQRRFHGEVTADANRELAAGLYERLEKEWADQPPAPTSPPAPAPPAADTTVTHAEVDGRRYTLTKESVDSTKFRKGSEAEVWFMQHAMPRVELLMTKIERGPFGSPSWADRILAAAAWQQVNKRRYLMELIEILEDSNRLFGDWKADRPKRIQVG